MDFYTTPVSRAYVVDYLKWFDMPKSPPDGTTVTVIAIHTKDLTLWVVTYTILISILFTALGKLFTGFVITWFNVGNHGNRHAMLVAYYTSNTPTLALVHMALYFKRAVWHSRKKGKWAVNWDTVCAAWVLSSACLLLLAATYTTTYLVGGKRLVLRNASRANPNSIYLPKVPRDMGNQPNVYEGWVTIRAAAVTAAVGRVQGSIAKLRDRVHTDYKYGQDSSGNITFEFTYNYEVNSTDWGLQYAHGLKYLVRGRCVTEYSWLKNIANDESPLPRNDTYILYGNETAFRMRASYEEGRYAPPRVSAFDGPDVAQKGNFQFGMVPNTVYRNSKTENTKDPWYITEEDQWRAPGSFGGPYRVAPGRPPLSCVQNDTWRLNDNFTHSVADLQEDLPDLHLSELIRGRIFPREFAQPPILFIANYLGPVGLRSGAEWSPNIQTFNASQNSISRDLDRLARTAFVYSREVVRDTVNLNPIIDAYSGSENAAGNPPSWESAEFIIESPDVAALRVSVLVSIPALCLFFWMIVLLRGKVYHIGTKTSNKGAISRHNLRSVALIPMQLYRYIDEEVTGLRRWDGRRSITPYIKDLEMENGEKGHRSSIASPNLGTDKQMEHGLDRSSSPASHPPSASLFLGTTTPEPATGTCEEPLPVSVGSQQGHNRFVKAELTPDKFAFPHLVPIQVSDTGEVKPALTEYKNPKRGLKGCIFFWRKPGKKSEKYELVMTDVFRKNLTVLPPTKENTENKGSGNVMWEEIRHNCVTEEYRKND